MSRKTGARGLRTIIEETLLDVMYEVPSRGDVAKCVVSGETIRRQARPLLVLKSDLPAAWGDQALQDAG